MTTWAMQITFTGGWVAIEPAQAVDAIEEGFSVMLTDMNWLLAEGWKQ